MKRQRYQFGEPYNTRFSGVSALGAHSGVVGIGIVGDGSGSGTVYDTMMIVGLAQSASSKDTRYVNCLVLNQKTKKRYVIKRPGFAASTTPSAGKKGYAIMVWKGQGSGDKVMSCFNNTNSTLFDGTTSKGAITGEATAITESIISGTATLWITSTDSTAWTYQDAGAATKIIDGSYPGAGGQGKTIAGTFAHLNGRAYIMDVNGDVWGGNINSKTAWSGANYFSTQSQPDKGIGVIRHRDNLIAFGRDSFEILDDAGNPVGSQLSRVSTHLLGCASSNAMINLSDTIFWAATTREGIVGLYAYNGQEIKQVSIPEVDQQMIIAGPGNLSLTSAGFYGRNFVVVNAGTTTFLYCVEEDNWHEWTGPTNLWHRMAGAVVGTSIANYSLSNSGTGGKVYVMNPAAIVYQDDGAAYTATIQTRKLDMDTLQRKKWSEIEIVADTESATSTLGVLWYDDDYVNPSASRSVDLSLARTRLTRCGSSRRRAFVLTHSANTAMRLEALDVTFEVNPS